MSSSPPSGYSGHPANETDDPRVPDNERGDPEWSEDDEDDDDMNYIPAPEESGDDIDEDDDDDGSYHGMRISHLQVELLARLLICLDLDAPEDFSGVEIEVEFTEGEDQDDEDDEDGDAAADIGDTNRPVYSK